MRRRLKVIRFPVASPVFDFIILGNNSDFGDRVARVEMPPGTQFTYFTCCTGTKVQILTQLWPPSAHEPAEQVSRGEARIHRQPLHSAPRWRRGFRAKMERRVFHRAPRDPPRYFGRSGLEECQGRQEEPREWRGSQLTCFTGTKVQIKSVRDDRRSPASGEVLSLLALLVQKYKY